MKEAHTAEMNILIKKMKRISGIINAGFVGGDYDKALKYIEQQEELIKGFQGDVPEEIKALHILWLYHRATTYAYRGNLALNFKYANKIFKKSYYRRCNKIYYFENYFYS